MREFNRSPEQANESSFLTSALLAMGVLVVAGVLLGIFYLNQKQEIAGAKEQIVKCRKQIEQLKPVISNRRTELAALQNATVVAYAANRGMITPNPGQVYMFDSNGRSSGVMVARKQQTQKRRISVATITPNTLR